MSPLPGATPSKTRASTQGKEYKKMQQNIEKAKQLLINTEAAKKKSETAFKVPFDEPTTLTKNNSQRVPNWPRNPSSRRLLQRMIPKKS